MKKALLSAIALIALGISSGCNLTPSRSSMYRAAREAEGARREQYTVMIAPYWLTGAKEGLPVEVVDLDRAQTFGADWDSRRLIRQRSDGRWEIIRDH